MTSDPKANILLVDDEPSNLLALEATLLNLGHNLVQARSGKEALHHLLHDDFALILMDVRMPDLDGLETASLIRARDRCRHTPIIFLTAYDRTDVQVTKGYSMGGVDYLLKPYAPEVLRSKVSVFVELYEKTEQIKRQAELLREKQQREHERQLAEEKQRWELERLRAEAAREKQLAAELAQKAEALARLNQEIQEAHRRKDEFLAMLAHELRNPLAPLRNALHILRLDPLGGPAAGQALEIAERQVGHLARLIEDLLDVSRITRGKIELRKEPVEFGHVIARAVESTGPLFAAGGHTLEVVGPPEPLWLQADPTRLEQVLANLLNNAAKYTEPGGRITLTAGREGQEVVLRVRDTGIGIPADMLERVFDLFTQAHRSLASSYQWGLGIGLALVRRLVELHGGSVQAFSEGPGTGSEFVVRLPLQAEPVAVPPESAAGGGRPAARPRRVLVVDDNQDAAQSLACLLELEGHEVRTAHDGTAALETARAFPPDVVLLDIGLPGLDGYQVARRLRELLGLEQALLVAVTGYGQEEDRRRAEEAGFDHHLAKPVDLEALHELLAGAELAVVSIPGERGVSAPRFGQSPGG
jgi:signal transduction histidine kinase